MDELLDFGVDSTGAIAGLQILKNIAHNGRSTFLVTHKEEQNRIMADIIEEFEKAPFIMKLFGLSKFVNKIIDRVARKWLLTFFVVCSESIFFFNIDYIWHTLY